MVNRLPKTGTFFLYHYSVALQVSSWQVRACLCSNPLPCHRLRLRLRRLTSETGTAAETPQTLHLRIQFGFTCPSHRLFPYCAIHRLVHLPTPACLPFALLPFAPHTFYKMACLTSLHLFFIFYFSFSSYYYSGWRGREACYPHQPNLPLPLSNSILHSVGRT